jgi:hypothetical protein
MLQGIEQSAIIERQADRKDRINMEGSIMTISYVVVIGILSIFALGDTVAAENARLLVMPILAASILGVISLYFFTKGEIEDIEGKSHKSSTLVKVLIGLGAVIAAPITILIDVTLSMVRALFVNAYSAILNNPFVEYKILDFLYETEYQKPIIIGQLIMFIVLAVIYKYEEEYFTDVLICSETRNALKK